MNQQGVSGECVVPTMVQRLETLLFKTKHLHYHWIIILGGTNDLGYGTSAERIFNEGLKPMYDMVMNYRERKTKLIVMTVIENGYFAPEDDQDQNRQQLNEMIRHYVISSKDQERIYLIDLDKDIPYHNINDLNQREIIWDDRIHLKPDGYDRMALFIFQTIKTK